MRAKFIILAVAAFAALIVAGCQSTQRMAPDAAGDRERGIRLVLTYDANSDGTITRAELEEGLHRQFAVVDTNHDGRLDSTEVRAENDRRWQANGTAVSPLIDWNQDGVVDFDEFATTARSVFEELDRDHNGVLTPEELRLPAARGMAPGGQPQGPGGGRRRGMPPP
jgi:Ca2+-binding EF-hand superfamily protein